MNSEQIYFLIAVVLAKERIYLKRPLRTRPQVVNLRSDSDLAIDVASYAGDNEKRPSQIEEFCKKTHA